MVERDFARFEFKMSFGWMSYISQHPKTWPPFVALSRPCFAQNFKTILQLRYMFWANETSRRFSARWVSEGYPILQQLARHHDDVIKWNIFRVTGHLCGNSPHKGQWRGALMFSLIYTRINGWVNNGEAGDLRHHRAHFDVTVMHQIEWMPTRKKCLLQSNECKKFLLIC